MRRTVVDPVVNVYSDRRERNGAGRCSKRVADYVEAGSQNLVAYLSV